MENAKEIKVQLYKNYQINYNEGIKTVKILNVSFKNSCLGVDKEGNSIYFNINDLI